MTNSGSGIYEMTSLDIQRANGVASLQSRRSRLYEIEAKYILDTDQDTPLRVLHGRDFISATQLMPVFGLETHTGSSGGKDEAPEPTTYSAGIALAICCGRLDKIFKIENSDDQIWSDDDGGGLLLSNNGANELSLGSGVLRIYPGSMEQTIDPALESITVVDKNGDSVEMNHSAYRGVAYFVSNKFHLGKQNTMPNIRIECQRIPKALEENTPEGYVFPWSGIELPDEVESNATLFPHCTVSGDMYPPEIIYDFLTDTFYGAGLDPALIDYDSFIQAQYTCVNEGIYISSVIDQQSSLQDIIAQLLEYVDGILTLKNGLISIRLFRWNDTPLNGEGWSNIHGFIYLSDPDFSVKNLIDEPEIKVDSSETNNVTTVTFNDRLAQYESTSESFECHLARRSYGDEIVSYTIDRPFAKSRIVASKIAKRIGFARAFPSIEITCKTIAPISGPVSGSVATVGDLVTIGYEKLQIFETDNRNTLAHGRKPHALLRIYQITYGAPDDPVVTYVCRLHRRYNPQIEDVLNNTIAVGGTGAPSLSKQNGWLRPHILLTKENQFIVFNGRPPSSAMVGYNVWFAPGTEGGEYEKLKAVNMFQIPAVLLDWTVFNSGTDKGIKLRLLVQKKISGAETEYCEIIGSEFAPSGEFYLYTAAYRRETVDGGTVDTQTGYNMVFEAAKNSSGTYIEADEINVRRNENEVITHYTVPNSETEYSANDYYIFYVNVSKWAEGSQSIETENDKKFYPSQTIFLSKKEGFGFYKYETWINNERSFRVRTQALFGGYGEETLDNEEDPGKSPLPTLAHTTNPSGNKQDNLITTVFDPTSCNWGNIVVGSGSVTVNESDGTVYAASSDNWEVVGKMDLGDSKQYYLSYNQSATMEHESGKEGVIHLHAVDDDRIVLTVPPASTAKTGDKITIIFTAATGVTDKTATISNAGESINMGVGMVMQLVCTVEGNIKKWMPILLSKSN